jgi:hypothetical protein
MLVIFANHVTEAVVIFSNLRCFISFLRLRFDVLKYDKYHEYFQNENVLQVAQRGHYDGPDATEEYMKYVDPSFTKYGEAIKLTATRFRSEG